MIERVRASLRRAGAAGLSVDGQVANSLAVSLRRAMLLALCAWNVLLVAVALLADPRHPVMLAALHGALAGLALVSLRRELPLEVVLLPGYVLWLVDYLAARSVDDALTLAACWFGDLLFAAPALALTHRGRTWFPVVGSTVVVAVLVMAPSMWTLQESSAFVVTALGIVAAVRFAMPSLWAIAAGADGHLSRLESELAAQDVARRAAAEAAEDARLIHDTVINTLGAVANGVQGISPEADVRALCRRDLAVVEDLLAGRRDGRELAVLDRAPGDLQVRRSGLTGADLDELAEVLSPATTDAIVGATSEALRNVAKHAGVRTVDVDVSRTDTAIVVTVTDRGRGFDVAEDVPDRGMARSIRGRVAAVDGDVRVESRPGSGTSVRISCPLRPVNRPNREIAADPAAISDALILRACWLLSAGIVAVGFVIEAANRPGQVTWTYAMLGLVGVCVGLSFLVARGRPRLPLWATLLLIVSLPLGFLAAIAGVDLGRSDVLYFQAIGVSPLLIILLTTATTRAARAGAVLLAGGAAGLAVAMSSQVVGYGLVVGVAVLPALGLAAGWAFFQKLIREVVAESENARRLAYSARVDLEARQEISEARRRWGTAGLRRSADLLRQISDGRLDIAAPAVCAQCADEEQHLRQLLMLNPSAYRLSGWFAHALAAARERDVRLVIRAGENDAPDDASAARIGALLLGAVAGSHSGSDLVVGWFPSRSGQRLVLVGPANRDGEVIRPGNAVPSSWRVVRTVTDLQEVVEVLIVP